MPETFGADDIAESEWGRDQIKSLWNKPLGLASPKRDRIGIAFQVGFNLASEAFQCDSRARRKFTAERRRVPIWRQIR